jgi:hypothetical protein
MGGQGEREGWVIKNHVNHDDLATADENSHNDHD